ncbi:glycosyltransferase family 4 protein [Natronosalvus caseinilyticus]|uniref:glycosyltransferase family 4 protein n=1 Tax=Natronosalvus caseinilyticus TaxID=2953747 RepID=UPI0028A93A2D|nr:glycosyltransferase family 4 protein [Natronosalvus caseinilyticus]
MRIAFVSFETAHHRETETNERFRTVLDLLTNRGHEIHVCCAQFWPGEASTLERDDVVYHGVSTGLEARQSFLLRLPFVLRSIGPDVIHASADPAGQARAANWGATLARAPMVLEWYGAGIGVDGAVGIPDDRGHRYAARNADRIVTPSRMVRTWVRERGASGERVDVVPNPIDLERIEATPPGDRVDVVYARRLDEGANLESLLLGLAELRDRNWHTLVLGDGPQRGMYEQLTRDLRIDDRVTFAGETSRNERIAAYRSAHVFAQTATECVFPTEFAWALGAGCVGIVEYHADSAAHELVEGWERGFRTTSEQELADAILEAGDLEHRTYDESFANLDRGAVLETYLETYRELQDARGLL